MFDYRNTLTPKQDSMLAVFKTRKGDRSYKKSVLAMANSIIAHPEQLNDKGPEYLATLAWALGDLAGTEETCLGALETLLSTHIIMRGTNAMQAFNPRELILVAHSIAMAADSRWSPPIVKAVNEIVSRLNDRNDLTLMGFMPNMLADTVNSLSRLVWLNNSQEPVIQQLEQIPTVISQDKYDLGSCSIQDLSYILQSITSVLGRTVPNPKGRIAINLIAEHLVNRETAGLQRSPQHLLNLQQNLVESIGLANMPSVAPAISRIAELMMEEVFLTTLEPHQLANSAHTLSEVLSLPNVSGAMHSMEHYIYTDKLNLESLSLAQLATLTTSFLANLTLLQNTSCSTIRNDGACCKAIVRIAAYAENKQKYLGLENLNTEDSRHLFMGFSTTAHIIQANADIINSKKLQTLLDTATVFSEIDSKLREDINAFNHQNPELPSARLGLSGRVMENPGTLPQVSSLEILKPGTTQLIG